MAIYKRDIDFQKLDKMRQNWTKLDTIGQHQTNGQHWTKLDKIGQNWTKLDKQTKLDKSI